MRLAVTYFADQCTILESEPSIQCHINVYYEDEGKVREVVYVATSYTGHEGRRSVPPSEAAANERCSSSVYITGEDVSHSMHIHSPNLHVTKKSLKYI